MSVSKIFRDHPKYPCCSPMKGQRSCLPCNRICAVIPRSVHLTSISGVESEAVGNNRQQVKAAIGDRLLLKTVATVGDKLEAVGDGCQ